MMGTDTAIDIVPIPALHDNYIWIVSRAEEQGVFVVDPGDAEPVLKWLRDHDRRLAGILITHHHPDHVGGVSGLIEFAPVPVYGPSPSPADCITHPLSEHQTVQCIGLDFEVLKVPGHTLDHIAYYAAATNRHAPILFSGDSLFAGGCGRLFEGTAPQMHHSLGKLSILPDNTEVYCAHEYTLANLRFALAIEPHNSDLQQRWVDDSAALASGRPTIPSSIALEKRTNPFIRTLAPEVASAAMARMGNTNLAADEIFRVLREWKDNF